MARNSQKPSRYAGGGRPVKINNDFTGIPDAKDLDAFESAISNLSYEVGGIFDSDGKLLQATTDTTTENDEGGNSVRVSQYSDILENSIFTHNHPSGRSFSNNDIIVAARRNLQEMRAIGVSSVDGRTYLYRMTRPESGWHKNQERATNMTSQVAENRVKAKLEREVRKGTMTSREAFFEEGHRINIEIANTFGYRYTRTLMENIPSIYDNP